MLSLRYQPASRLAGKPTTHWNLPHSALLLAVLVLWGGARLHAADCDGNGMDDRADFAQGGLHDCNRNGTPDECELQLPPLAYVAAGSLRGPRSPGSGFLAADFNADGISDIAYASGGAVVLFLSEGPGSYGRRRTVGVPTAHAGETVEGFIAKDADGDGDIDLVLLSSESEIIAAINSGDGSFSAQDDEVVSLDELVEEIEGGDFNGDGALDLVISVLTNKAYIAWGDGDGGFTLDLSLELPVRGRSRPLIEDFDGDGDVDILAALRPRTTDVVYLFRNKGDGTFTLPQEADFNPPPLSMRGLPQLSCDWNSDGAVDFMSSISSSEIALYLNDGNGGFSLLLILENVLGGFCTDVDGDGDIDLVTRGAGGNAQDVFLNDGFGHVALRVAFPSDSPRRVVLFGDFNGDGFAHYVWADPTPGVYNLELRAAGGGMADDCDGNGVLDSCQIEAGELEDCDGDGVADLCAIARGEARDCNENGIVDACEVAAGTLDFTSRRHVTLPELVEPRLVADVDGDGALDILACGNDRSALGASYYNACLVFSARSGGGFHPPRRILLHGSVNPGLFISTDLDGDGDLDFAGAFGEICWNAGEGYFSACERIPLDGVGDAVVAGDLDADGAVDLVFPSRSFAGSSPGFAGLQVFRNDGSGAFSPWYFVDFVELGYRRAYAAASGDVDADGDLDVAVVVEDSGPSGWLQIFSNDGRGGLDPSERAELSPLPGLDGSALAVGDPDRDGLPEFVVASGLFGGIAYVENGGSGKLTAAAIEADGSPRGERVEFVDADADGWEDLFLTGDGVHILWNDGSGIPAGGAESWMLDDGRGWEGAVGDLDLDGKPDLVVRSGLRLLIYYGDGERNFVRRDGLSLPANPNALVAGDFNGDGVDDVLAGTQFGGLFATRSRVDLLLSDGAGGLQSGPVLLDEPGSMARVVAGDFDGNGYLDAAVSRFSGTGEIRVILQDSPGRFRTLSPVEGAFNRNLVSADFDGDGAADLAAGGTEIGDRGGVFFFSYRGAEGLQAAGTLESQDFITGLAAGDLDADGDADLIAGGAQGTIRVAENRGGFEWEWGTEVALPFRSPGELALGDIDGDGDLDLAVREEQERPVALLQNDGEGHLSLAGVYDRDARSGTSLPRTLFNTLETADLDGDGVEELIVAKDPTGEVTIVRWTEAEGFEEIDRVAGFFSVASVVAGEFDGKGPPDLLVADFWGRDVFLAENVAPFGSQAGDCDGNGVPDECDILVADCNGNAVPDDCDILQGTSSDENADGIPDECNGGYQFPGDCNGDSQTDISDALCILGVLFTGMPERFPCGDGTPVDQANVAFLDYQQDGHLDITDAIVLLNFLMSGEPLPPLLNPGGFGPGCRFFADCPSNSLCR